MVVLIVQTAQQKTETTCARCSDQTHIATILGGTYTAANCPPLHREGLWQKQDSSQVALLSTASQLTDAGLGGREGGREREG